MFDRKQTVFAALALSFVLGAGPASAQIELISRVHPSLIADTAGGEVTSISADGRYVAFHSSNGNLTPVRPAGHNMPQVYLYDRQTGARTLVSRTHASATAGGDNQSDGAVLSADGRFVVYSSDASDLVTGLVKPLPGAQLFLYDRTTGSTVLVSHASTSPATGADSYSVDPVISADGRYVAFASPAENLVAGQNDPNSFLDVFLFDRLSGTITLVSREAGAPTTTVGGFFPILSADGAYVAFFSASASADGHHELFLYETASGTISRVSRRSDDPTVGEIASFETPPSLSADGRFVAFVSSGEHLVSGQTESDLTRDVFVFDRVTGTTVLASRKAGSTAVTGNARSEAPTLSADGRYVAFVSWATDLVAGQSDSAGTPDVFLHDLTLGTTILVSRQSDDVPTTAHGASLSPSISADGSQVVFSRESGYVDPSTGLPVFLYDLHLFERATGVRRRVSSPAAGLPDPDAIRSATNPVINADGAYVAYSSLSTDLVSGLVDTNTAKDAFLYNRSSESNTIVSRRDPGAPDLSAPGSSDTPLISADGRFVAYLSSASWIVPGFVSAQPETLYLHDRQTGITVPVASGRVSSGSNELLPLGISADGRFLTFASPDNDLVPGQVDGFNSPDIFSFDRIAGTITLLSHTADSPVTGGSFAEGARVTPDGRYVSFLSTASNLVPGQVSMGGSHVFLHDRVTGTTELIDHASGAPTQEGNGWSMVAAVSADGRYVAWTSYATNLMPGVSDTNGAPDLFLRDRRTGTTILLSRSFNAPGTAANGPTYELVFSANGRCLAFTSWASNLLPGMAGTQGISNVFLYSLVTGKITLVSHAHGSTSTGGDGPSFSPSLSADCSAVTFKSFATNLFPTPPSERVALVLAEPVLGTLTLLGRGLREQGSFDSDDPAPVMSEDGRFAAFSTNNDILQGGADLPHTNLYLFDRVSREVVLVSRANGSPTTPADNFSFQPGFSSDSRSVVFTSSATNLVANDFGAGSDVFVFDNELALGGDFYTLAPCRLLDTRQPEDGPVLTSGTPVIFEVDGGCGIPATARALALNITVFDPTGQGNLSLGPGDAAPSGTSSINFLPGVNRANNAIVPLSLDGSASVAVRPLVAGGGTVHVILDVVGYFE